MQYFEPAIESDEKLSPVCDVADHFGAGEPVSKPATGAARQRRVAAVSHAEAVLCVCRSGQSRNSLVRVSERTHGDARWR